MTVIQLFVLTTTNQRDDDRSRKVIWFAKNWSNSTSGSVYHLSVGGGQNLIVVRFFWYCCQPVSHVTDIIIFSLLLQSHKSQIIGRKCRKAASTVWAFLSWKGIDIWDKNKKEKMRNVQKWRIEKRNNIIIIWICISCSWTDYNNVGLVLPDEKIERKDKDV